MPVSKTAAGPVRLMVCQCRRSSLVPVDEDHLRSATQAENIRHAVEIGRHRGNTPVIGCGHLWEPLPNRPRCCTPKVGRARLPDGEADAHRQRRSTRTRAETQEVSTQVPDHTVSGPGYLYCGVLLPYEGARGGR